LWGQQEHRWSSEPPACHPEGPVSIPEWTMWVLWRVKWQRGLFSSEYLSFSLSIFIQRMLQIYSLIVIRGCRVAR
jgi:hypothetical protein